MTVEEMVLYLTMDHCTNDSVLLQDPLEMEMVPLMDEEKSLMDEAMSLRDGVTLSSSGGGHTKKREPGELLRGISQSQTLLVKLAAEPDIQRRSRL